MEFIALGIGAIILYALAGGKKVIAPKSPDSTPTESNPIADATKAVQSAAGAISAGAGLASSLFGGSTGIAESAAGAVGTGTVLAETAGASTDAGITAGGATIVPAATTQVGEGTVLASSGGAVTPAATGVSGAGTLAGGTVLGTAGLAAAGVASTIAAAYVANKITGGKTGGTIAGATLSAGGVGAIGAVAAVGAAQAGSEIDRAFGGTGQGATGIVAQAGAAAITILTFAGPIGWLIELGVAANLSLLYAITSGISDLTRLSYGQAGARHDYDAQWEQTFEHAKTLLIEKGLDSKYVGITGAIYTDGYMISKNRLAYHQFMLRPRGFLGLGGKDDGYAAHFGSDRGYFVGTGVMGGDNLPLPISGIIPNEPNIRWDQFNFAGIASGDKVYTCAEALVVSAMYSAQIGTYLEWMKQYSNGQHGIGLDAEGHFQYGMSNGDVPPYKTDGNGNIILQVPTFNSTTGKISWVYKKLIWGWSLNGIPQYEAYGSQTTSTQALTVASTPTPTTNTQSSNTFSANKFAAVIKR